MGAYAAGRTPGKPHLSSHAPGAGAPPSPARGREGKMRRASRSTTRRLGANQRKTMARTNVAIVDLWCSRRAHTRETAIGRVRFGRTGDKAGEDQSVQRPSESKSQPEIKAGPIPGRVILLTAQSKGCAPNRRGSSRCGSNRPSLGAHQHRRTKQRAQTSQCATVIVSMLGSPNRSNSRRRQREPARTAEVTSCRQRGPSIVEPERRRSGKPGNRDMLKPALCRGTSESVAAVAATSSWSFRAEMPRCFKSRRTRGREPAHTVTSRGPIP